VHIVSRIGIEINGVVCDLLASAYKAFGDPRQPEAYSIQEMYPTVSDRDICLWLESRSTYAKIPAIQNSISCVNELLLQYDVYAITNRIPELLRVTCEWLSENGLDGLPVICTHMKSEEVQNLDLDFFIESNADDARMLSKICKTFIVDKPYNRFGTKDAIRILELRQIHDHLR